MLCVWVGGFSNDKKIQIPLAFAAVDGSGSGSGWEAVLSRHFTPSSPWEYSATCSSNMPYDDSNMPYYDGTVLQ